MCSRAPGKSLRHHQSREWVNAMIVIPRAEIANSLFSILFFSENLVIAAFIVWARSRRGGGGSCTLAYMTSLWANDDGDDDNDEKQLARPKLYIMWDRINIEEHASLWRAHHTHKHSYSSPRRLLVTPTLARWIIDLQSDKTVIHTLLYIL